VAAATMGSVRATGYVSSQIGHVALAFPTAPLWWGKNHQSVRFTQFERKTYARLINLDCIYLIEGDKEARGVAQIDQTPCDRPHQSTNYKGEKKKRILYQEREKNQKLKRKKK
jgi:hypothetical protein